MRSKALKFFILCVCGVILIGCGSRSGNVGRMQSFGFAPIEADWIRNGEPIEFETELWYPVDDIEILLDSEVHSVAQYRGTGIFVSKFDVRPYQRLYTKFGRNQFRIFEKKITS